MRLALAIIGVCAAAAAPGLAAQPRGSQGSLPAWARCVASASGSTAEPVHRLTALNDKAVVDAAIGRVFAEREREQRVSAPNLASARLSIDFLYLAGPEASRVYYYEASKTIPDAEGLLRVAVAGWLRVVGTVVQPLGSKSELHWSELSTDSDAEQPVIPEPPVIPGRTADLAPLGVLTRAGQQTWVMKRQTGRGAVLVYDIGAMGVRLRPASSVAGC